MSLTYWRAPFRLCSGREGCASDCSQTVETDETTVPLLPRAGHGICAAGRTRFLFDRRCATQPRSHDSAATARNRRITSPTGPTIASRPPTADARATCFNAAISIGPRKNFAALAFFVTALRQPLAELISEFAAGYRRHRARPHRPRGKSWIDPYPGRRSDQIPPSCRLFEKASSKTAQMTSLFFPPLKTLTVVRILDAPSIRQRSRPARAF
jgi:hypothetical protein